MISSNTSIIVKDKVLMMNLDNYERFTETDPQNMLAEIENLENEVQISERQLIEGGFR